MGVRECAHTHMHARAFPGVDIESAVVTWSMVVAVVQLNECTSYSYDVLSHVYLGSITTVLIISCLYC